ncbi:RmlC-like cupin domain-containing protein [Peziza echinospora]|nr:RmlC-like cupin domain-containing protein [Peziza echinospora]
MSSSHSQPPCFLPLTTPLKPDTPYGKLGSNSLAARLVSELPHSNFTPDPNVRYGEMWIGDHPSNPSSVSLRHAQTPLKEYINKYPELFLGKAVYEKFHDDLSVVEKTDAADESGRNIHLPFLFKILSFDRALPLQTHPDRTLAARLLKRAQGNPNAPGLKQITDLNYKPEVAVCISKSGFKGFIGFRSISDIQYFLTTIPEFQEAVGDKDTIDAFLAYKPTTTLRIPVEAQQQLKSLFIKIIERDDSQIAEICKRLLSRLLMQGDENFFGGTKHAHLGNVLRKCLSDYPGDKGVFVAIFMMNFITLMTGEGVMVGVDELHAYLEGDIIECMAWGDNMLSHGFQPPSERSPAKDFIPSVSYIPRSSTIPLRLPRQPWSKSEEGRTTQYLVPLAEFDLLHVLIGAEQEEVVTPGGVKGPTIFVVVDGEVELRRVNGDERLVLQQGSSVYILPGTTWSMRVTGGKEASIWGAFVEAE